MWLHVPPQFMDSRCALVSEDSISDLESQYPDIALFAMSNGKPIARPLSWPEWKNRPWIKRLYGTILRLSTASRGVESWISFLRETRVNRSLSSESIGASTTNDIFGLKYCELSERFGRDLYFSKTFHLQTRLNFDGDANKTWREWGTALKQDYSQRRKWAHHIRDSGCSCWPTAMASDAKQSGGRKPGHQITMFTDRAVWEWSIPKAADAVGDKLKDQVKNWPTPLARDQKGACGLEGQIRKDGKSRTLNHLPDTVLYRFSLPDTMTLPHGVQYSPDNRKLNPLFVEWLMGFPPGWCGLKESPPWGMPLYQWLRRWRLYLFGTG